ncbi:MAG: hypothetical protein ACP8RL_03835 [cyanobacterium endosymbiont of Rhopalodia inflata]
MNGAFWKKIDLNVAYLAQANLKDFDMCHYNLVGINLTGSV